MIVADKLTRRFGRVVAVDSVSFRIPQGRVVGFLGPNGAGKTTTIRMIAGFLPPTAGTVAVAGLDVMKRPLEVRRRIGYLPESTPLYEEMRVVEYLRFRARLYGLGLGKRRAIDAAIARCDLGSVRRRLIRQLSRGFRQRVGLAAALLHEPPVLILDEPTVGLDPAQIRSVRDLIRELAGKHTILLSTHILPEVELACDDVIMMAAGRIRMQGSIASLRDTAARGARYVVETDSANAADMIRVLPSVEHVDERVLGDTWIRLTITPVAGADDRREVIGRTLRKAGAAVRELKREAPSLEQMFVEVVAGAERVEPPGAAGKVGGVGGGGRGAGPGGGAKGASRPEKRKALAR